ncbi:MAG: STAS domain-containing protein, partial [Clostridia bacterium]|nr:STAS domain-containing protein [Clostridia bacterium]
MKITKNMNGTNLTIALEGRLDTTTAPELEKALKDSIEAATELTLDFAALDYISSAGLRVLLSAHKTMS